MVNNSSLKEMLLVACFGFSISMISGCWLVAAGGAGAEAGYVGSQESRTSTETLTDQRITATIKTRLLTDAETPGLDINVDTYKGIVTLKGVLKNTAQIDEAIHLASTVEGVVRVDSKLYLE